jgi:hypothetical protein
VRAKKSKDTREGKLCANDRPVVADMRTVKRKKLSGAIIGEIFSRARSLLHVFLCARIQRTIRGTRMMYVYESFKGARNATRAHPYESSSRDGMLMECF